MKLADFYVLISRVRTLDSLRLLQYDREALFNVGGKQHPEFLTAWEGGYDTNGRWDDKLAIAALANVRRVRLQAKQARAAEKKAQAEKMAAQKRASAAAELSAKKGRGTKRGRDL